MHFRRSAALALAAAALVSTGCQTKLDDRGLSQADSVAVFDPTKNAIPLPNDLALAQVAAAAQAGCPGAVLPTAQAQFLCALAASGGFPNDQEVPLTFAFARQRFDAGTVLTDPVALDTTTVKVLGAVTSGATVAVIDVTNPAAPTPVVVEASFDAATSTLKLRKPAAADGSRRWAAGHKYVAFVRGGASGVKTAAGGELQPMPTMFVLREAIISNRDLSLPENQTLLPGTAEQKAAAGAQLEQIRLKYLPLKALYEGVGLGTFGDMVDLLTFAVAPSQGVVVEVDATKGSAPLPIDLLRAPDAAGGLILDNPAFGPARTGLVTLDGFSTTAPITAPLTDPAGVASVDASTVNGGSVLVYELGGSGPTMLPELKALVGGGGDPATAKYVAQPPGSYLPADANGCPSTPLGCAGSLVFQPAVAVSTVGPFLPPLKEGTKYAVVVTKGVKDLQGRPLARSTVARILLQLTAPIDASIGVDAGTAALLQQMRGDLAPVWAALPTGVTKADVAMAYVFRTQSITGTSLALSGLPYHVEQGAGLPVFNPVFATSVTSQYPDVTGAYGVYDVGIPSVDATSKVTGALDPVVLGSPTLIAQHIAPLHAIVAVPDVSAVPYCSGTSGPRCAPLVVFGHGLHGSKAELVAPGLGTSPPVNALLAKGFVVASVDFPQHGVRSWCFASAQCDAAGSPAGTGDGTCTPFPELAGLTAPYQSDLPNAPGVCTGGSTPNPAVSGQTFIGANFFRMRDTFRQNLIDQSALVLALARPPGFPNATAYTAAAGASAFAPKLAEAGIYAIDGLKVYWEGISLGALAGTEVLSTNPRFSRGLASSGGATLVDIATSPASSFFAQVTPLFSALLAPQLAAAGHASFDIAYVTPGSPSYDPAIAAAYGKTLLVAKWILDPGEALNYARYVRGGLPDLLADPSGATAQAAKDVLGQIGEGDTTIPNAQGWELLVNSGIGSVLYTSDGTVPSMHGMLDYIPRVQSDAATYLDSLTTPTAPFVLSFP